MKMHIGATYPSVLQSATGWLGVLCPIATTIFDEKHRKTVGRRVQKRRTAIEDTSAGNGWKNNWAYSSWRRQKQGQSGSWLHIFEWLIYRKGERLIAREKLGHFWKAHVEPFSGGRCWSRWLSTSRSKCDSNVQSSDVGGPPTLDRKY